MKLKTKLIPLATIAGVAAAVTPLALTSCSKSNWTDISRLYTPTFEQAVGPIENCEDFYFSKVKENPDIFAQDFYHGQSLWFLYYASAQGVTLENVHIYVHDVSVGETDKEYDGKKYPTMSYVCDFDFKLNYSKAYVRYTNVDSIRTYGSFTLENVPYHLEWMSTAETDVPGWTPRIFRFSGSEEPVSDFDKTWKIMQNTTTVVEQTYEGTDLHFTDTYVSNKTVETSYDFVQKFLINEDYTMTCINDSIASYFMSKIDQGGN